MMLCHLLMLSAAAVVLVRCACLAAHLDVKTWGGPRARFAAFAASISMTGAGALGVALAWAPAGMMLLLGLAGLVLFGRRSSTWG